MHAQRSGRRARRVAAAGIIALAIAVFALALAARAGAGAGAGVIGASRFAPPRAAPSDAGSGDTTAARGTRVLMRNVGFHLDDQIVMRIRYLEGTMRSKRPGTPVFFDDKAGFVIHIDRASVGLTTEDMTLLLNRYVFGYRGSPLRDLRVSTAGGRIKQRGILHKVVDIPFEITAELSVTPDGHIRLHPVATRIFDVDGAGLMRALNLTLEKLLDLSKAKGASVKGNDLFLAPDSIVPPPTIEGRVTAVRVVGDQIVQQFGDSAAGPGRPAPLEPPDTSSHNFMYYRGGLLRFGKLIMLDADMQIEDADERDPFDFAIDHYNVQLVAGYSRSTPEGGLEVFMPDYDDATKMLAARRTLAPPRPGGRP